MVNAESGKVKKGTFALAYPLSRRRVDGYAYTHAKKGPPWHAGVAAFALRQSGKATICVVINPSSLVVSVIPAACPVACSHDRNGRRWVRASDFTVGYTQMWRG